MGKAIKIPLNVSGEAELKGKNASQESNENKWLNKRTTRVLQVDHWVEKNATDKKREG